MSQSTDLQPFVIPGGEGELRIVVLDSDPWFVASDVARVLGYRDAEKATRLLKADEKGTHRMGTPGGQQEYTIISEPGFYRLVMRSNRPEADSFQRWVTREVLPQIRRTGSYAVSHPAVPQSFADALELAAKQAREIEQAQRTIGEQRKTLDWAEPRAQYVDAFVRGAEDATKIRDLAAQLGVREHQLRGWLTTRRLAYKDSDGQWKAYAQPATSPRRHWFVLRDQPEAPRMHNDQLRKTLYVTPVGCVGIADLLAKHPI